MNTIPKSIKDAITSSVSVMLTSLAIPQANINGAFAAFFSELDGKGTKSITNTEPLDRLLSRKQVADLLSCSLKTVSDKVRAGKLNAVYGGADGKRLTGISEESVRAFMEGRTK